ncbi:MAG: adenylosuccinate synthetase, partial [Nitrospinota bacterium]
WFDTVAARYAVMLNRCDLVALTLLDVLGGFDAIPVCVAYRYGQSRLTEFPSEPWVLEQVKPEFETLPGWKEEITGVREFRDLPARARDYVERIAGWIGVPVGLLSTGPAREQRVLPEGTKLKKWFP